MPLQIYSGKNLPQDKWSKLTSNSIYASPEFASVWRTMKSREIYLVEEQDGEFRAGMTGMVFGKKFLRRFQSMPDGFLGGPYFGEGFEDSEKKEFIDSITKWLKSMNIIRADIHRPHYDLESRYLTRRETTTHIISLEKGFYSPPSPKITKHINIGKKRGAVVSELNDIKNLEDFYQLVIKTETRHGSKPRYSLEFFNKLFEISKDDHRILWLMVHSENKMIGSRICFIDGSEILLWQFYSDKEYRTLKPGYLLLDHIINYTLDNNIKELNLGWSPPWAESLIDYKESLGARSTVFPYYTYFGGIGKLIYGWRER